MVGTATRDPELKNKAEEVPERKSALKISVRKVERLEVTKIITDAES
jgi:hypothetical protein